MELIYGLNYKSNYHAGHSWILVFLGEIRTSFRSGNREKKCVRHKSITSHIVESSFGYDLGWWKHKLKKLLGKNFLRTI